MANTSENLTGCQPQPSILFGSIFMSFTYFVGFVLNCISLWIFWFRVKDWSSTVILQFNLAISDASITPAVPLIVIYSWTDHWTFGAFFCQFTAFLLGIHVYGSICFLTLISINRYFTVVQNDKRKALTKKPFIKKLCIFIWCFVLLQAVPVFFLLQTSEVYGVMKCLNIHQTEQAVLFFVANWLILFSGLLIPFITMMVCYSLLSQYILKVNPMNAATNLMVSKSVQTIFVSLTIFIICFIPVHIVKTMAVTINLFFPSMCTLLQNAEVAYYFTSLLFSTNCCLDPIIYCYASEKFKQTISGWCSCLNKQ